VQCGDPFCTTIGCPLGNTSRNGSRRLPEGLEKAPAQQRELTVPEILGRICRTTASAKGLHPGGWLRAITIGPIEASINRSGFAAGHSSLPGITPAGRWRWSVPARGDELRHFLLRAASAWRCRARPYRGGLLACGIPGFKLDKRMWPAVSRSCRRLAETAPQL